MGAILDRAQRRPRPAAPLLACSAPELFSHSFFSATSSTYFWDWLHCTRKEGRQRFRSSFKRPLVTDLHCPHCRKTFQQRNCPVPLRSAESQFTPRDCYSAVFSLCRTWRCERCRAAHRSSRRAVRAPRRRPPS